MGTFNSGRARITYAKPTTMTYVCKAVDHALSWQKRLKKVYEIKYANFEYGVQRCIKVLR
jgi:hypothetical protein